LSRVPPRPARAANPRPSGADIGSAGERLAAQHLERRGFAVIERNYRTRAGEIDLIAFDGRTLVFAEVKTSCRGAPRAARVSHATPLERLSPRQRGRLCRVAGAWLRERHPRPHADTIRLDAIGVLVDPSLRLLRLDHVEAAW
jgi:putative endonuclease